MQASEATPSMDHSARENRENPPASLSLRVTAAAAWMIVFRWLDRLIGIASVAVLARLLTPDDFGLVAYATLVIGVVELFTGLATDAELIRYAHPDRAYYNAAWTMNVARGVAITLLLIGLVGPASQFFEEPRLRVVMLTLAAMPLLQGFENVGIVDFRKGLEFDREFRFLLTARVVGTVATIGLAFAMRNYWALVAGTLFRTAFRVLLSYKVHPFRPRFDVSRIAEMFRFSRWMMILNLAGGLSERLPGLVVGREWGSSVLAYLNVGREIAELSTTEIRAPIRRALYPGLAQIVHQPARLADVLVRCTGMLALLTLPIALGLALVADDLVPLVLGAQWHPTISLLQPLCVGGAITALGTNSHLAYMALNRSHLAALAAALRALLLLALLLAVSPTCGAIGAAYAIAGMACFMTIIDYALAPRLLGIAVARFLAVVWRPLVAALAMAGAVWLLRSNAAPANDLPGHASSLARSALLGSSVYIACVITLWTLAGRVDGAERWLLALVKNRYVRLVRSVA
jgi:lipopolysaccharide exporter